MINNPVKLLESLIAVPSISRQEHGTADLLEQVLSETGIETSRIYNNVWALQPHYNSELPTLLLNSHHDTVKPSPSYTRDPYSATVADGRIYGLGSNDAGASVVTLANLFARMYNERLPFNLVLALTAEEEVMGEHGMRAMLPHFEESGIRIDMALVGEPTGMRPAVAERGLVVLDCVAHGVSGHAARNEGVNALYNALDDIERLRHYRFPKDSDVLGPIGINVTQIQAGRQHNVIPDECRFVVDVRTTDAYTNEETVEILRSVIESEATPRSTRVRASVISENHPLVRAASATCGATFVSPTTSDMALMWNFPSLKMGPGESARSHTADEFVMIDEIYDAVDKYTSLIDNLAKLI